MKTIISVSRLATGEDVKKAMSLCPWTKDITEVFTSTGIESDLHGRQWAEEHGIRVCAFPVDWGVYGNKADYVLNEQMARYADGLIAVWDGKSRGTKNMIEQAEKRNLQVFIYGFGSLRVFEKDLSSEEKKSLEKEAKYYRAFRIDTEGDDHV